MEMASLMQMAQYVDKTVESLGIESPQLAKMDLNTEQAMIIIDSFYKSNHKLLEVLESREGLQETLTRSQDDVTQLRTMKARLKADLDKAANDAVTAAEVQRQSELKLKKQGEQLRASKDEVRLLKLEKQRLATHYEHFKKRLETENVKLKERLQKLLHDRNNERALGMKALNKIQSKDGKRGQWAKPDKADEDMQRMIVQTYEDRIKEVMLENSELRDSLVVLETELAAMLNAPGLGSLPPSPSRPLATAMSHVAAVAPPVPATVDASGAAASAPSPLKPGHFALPFAASRDGIEQSLKLRMASLKDRFQQLSAEAAASGKADVAEVTQLQAQLDECTLIIQRQQQALFADNATPSPGKSFLSDSILHEQADTLRQDKREFEEKLANFNSERQQFTQAAKKLDRDRARVQAAKIQLPMTPIQGTPVTRPPQGKRGASSLANVAGASNFLPGTPMAFASTPQPVAAEPGVLGSSSTPTGGIDLARYLQ